MKALAAFMVFLLSSYYVNGSLRGRNSDTLQNRMEGSMRHRRGPCNGPSPFHCALGRLFEEDIMKEMDQILLRRGHHGGIRPRAMARRGSIITTNGRRRRPCTRWRRRRGRC